MISLRSFPAAPHRMMFVAGMLAATAGGLWWAAGLLARIGAPFMLPVAVAPMWAHAWIMLFGLLGPFVFGFLFTTFPRWQNGPEVPRAVYVPVFAALVASLVLALWGAMGSATLFLAGVVISCVAWLAAWVVLPIRCPSKFALPVGWRCLCAGWWSTPEIVVRSPCASAWPVKLSMPHRAKVMQ